MANAITTMCSGSERALRPTRSKRRYRSKAQELHPDRNADNPEAEGQFKEANEAYEVLKDADKKAAYDRLWSCRVRRRHGRRPARRPGRFCQRLLGRVRRPVRRYDGRRTRWWRARARTRGSDLRYNLRVDLEDAFAGLRKPSIVPTSVTCESCAGTGPKVVQNRTCPTCSGMGKVRAQQGFFTVERTCPTCTGMGHVIKNPCQRVRWRGSGREKIALFRSTSRLAWKPGPASVWRAKAKPACAADLGRPLYFHRGRPSMTFLNATAPTVLPRARQHDGSPLGGDIEVPTIDGGRSRVKIPAGSQIRPPDAPAWQRHAALRGGGQGDMLIELAVETPVNLTSRQRELLDEFSQLGEDNNPESSTFFSKVRSFWDGMTN